MLIVVATSAFACATYGPNLLEEALPDDPGGSAGVAGSSIAGGGQGAGGAAAGMAGEPEAGSPGMAGMPPVKTAPYVTVAISPSSVEVSLSAGGTLDWAHWGFKSAVDYNHKAGVTPQVLEFRPLGTQPRERFLNGPVSYSWYDGAPTMNATSRDGVSWNGEGEGVELVVPAEKKVRRLMLYVAVVGGTGNIHAELTDPDANSLVDDRFSSATETWVHKVIQLQYGNTDDPDTTLNISWKLERAMLPTAAVSISAMTLAH